MEFAEIARYYYFFEEFEVPFNDGVIEMKDVLRAIDDQAVPTALNPRAVLYLFSCVDNVYNPALNMPG